ncbi:MAG: hypothetical protein ACI4EX_04035 [Lachnospiraceae bacterium]
MSIKKNMFVLFMIVMMVMVAGCSDGKSSEGVDVTRTVEQGIEDVDSVVDTEEATEEVRPNPSVGHSTATMVETSENTLVSGSEESTVEKSNVGATTETQTEISEKSATSTESSNEETSTEAPQPTEPAPAKTEPEESETLESAIYDPYQVVNMVIAKCEAGGMITTEDNLANLLAEGKITQAEYDEYYPLDGLEDSYYSVFVETDLNIASDIVGNKLGSVEKIADYIAGMLLLETQPIFNVTYEGIYTRNGVDFYEFRCHR